MIEFLQMWEKTISMFIVQLVTKRRGDIKDIQKKDFKIFKESFLLLKIFIK